MSNLVTSPTLPDADAGAALPRLAWVDNLRTAMIALVVNMHACVTYSHVGSWYRMEDPEPAMPVKVAFVFWQAHLQSFFMGLLFFLAGAFAQCSLERRGPRPFLRERARRLGLPALLYMLLIHPFIVRGLLGHSQTAEPASALAAYGRYLTSGSVLSGSGPMWFAISLLIFSAILTVTRGRGVPGSVRQPGRSTPALNCLRWFGLGLGLTLATFLVRLVQPLGTEVLNFQLGYFPQYLAAFTLGILAGRHAWLEPLATFPWARRIGWFAVLGGPLLLGIIGTLGGTPSEEGANPYAGGWNSRAFAYATWEQFIGLGLALGALAWFRQHASHRGAIAGWLADRAFAVYVLHPPVLVALTPLLRPAVIHPVTGAALLTAAGLALSFVVADLARRLPGLRRIL